MFWKRLFNSEKPPVTVNSSTETALPTVERLSYEWAEHLERELVHDLLVRSAARLLPGLFTDNIEVTDADRFLRTVQASCAMLRRGIDIACGNKSVIDAPSGGLYYSLCGGAKGNLVGTIFHAFESVGDASGGDFLKKYIAEVNNNVHRDSPSGYSSFNEVLLMESSGGSSKAWSRQGRSDFIQLPLWGDVEPSDFYLNGLDRFCDYAVSIDTVASDLVKQVYSAQR